MRTHPAKESGDGAAGVWASMSRPRGLGVVYESGNLPKRRQAEVFKAGLFESLARLFVWLHAILKYAGGMLWDKLRRKDSVKRRARRLRRIIESAGASFIKLGQQLSIRIDVLPYEYALELEKVLDEIPLHPSRDEIEDVIRRTTGKSVDEIFVTLDPDPIGSASVSCVYLGRLRKNHKKVAVKVRRPGIGRQLAADMRVLGWLLWLAELFLLPHGYSRLFHRELSDMLFEELDFAKEARYSDLFRRRVKKAGMRFVTAPRVYFEYSGREVIVTELASGGFWLKEVIKAIESGDRRALAILEAQKIKPKKVARRLLYVARYGQMEGLLFHADLHPANVLVRPDSKLTLIDFGSCSSLTEKERHVWRYFMESQNKEDAGAMAQAGLGMFASIPPIDLEEFTAKLEAIFWQDIYVHQSKDAAWWERTSANVWAAVFSLAREYRIPIKQNLLRLIRMTLLADTLAVRLHHKIDYWDEYRRFAVRSGRRARRRLIGRLKWLKSNEAFIRYEEIFENGFAALYRIESFLDSSVVTLTRLQHVVAFGTALALRMLSHVALAAALLAGSRAAYFAARAAWTREGDPIGVFVDRITSFDDWYLVASNKWYLLFVLIVALVNARRLVLRLDYKEVNQ